MDPWREIARQAALGDPAAVRRLVTGVAPPVLRLVRAMLGARSADVEDVVQESMMALVRALGAFRGECTVIHFACRIAVRTALAQRRQVASQRERLERWSAGEGTEEAAAAGEPALAARRRELVRALLETLPAEQAESLALRVVLGCSMEEVAQATGAPVNTVRSRLRLAKEALRRRIEADPELSEMLEVAG